MTGGGDVIKKGIDKVQDAKSHAGDPAALTTVTSDSDVDPTITRVQFQPKDYRVSFLTFIDCNSQSSALYQKLTLIKL